MYRYVHTEKKRGVEHGQKKRDLCTDKFTEKRKQGVEHGQKNVLCTDMFTQKRKRGVEHGQKMPI